MACVIYYFIGMTVSRGWFFLVGKIHLDSLLLEGNIKWLIDSNIYRALQNEIMISFSVPVHAHTLF